MTETSLLTKYRPADWADVLGQDAVVRSLRAALKPPRACNSFLFVGPSGVGKTSLARLVAQEVGCQALDLLTIDAATHTGVDEMRAVTQDWLLYRPLGEGKVKVIILDECHMLSKNAWNSLLTSIEEPPDWIYWCLCTTEASKVPASVKTRCLTYELRPVSTNVLLDLLEDVSKAEKLKISADITRICAKEAEGSPRQALANLAVCLSAKSKEEAYELLQVASETAGAAIDLARALYKGASWKEIQAILVQLKTVNPESIRRVVCAYGTNMVLSSGGGNTTFAEPVLAVLDAFSKPFPNEGLTPVVIACGLLAWDK